MAKMVEILIPVANQGMTREEKDSLKVGDKIYIEAPDDVMIIRKIERIDILPDGRKIYKTLDEYGNSYKMYESDMWDWNNLEELK